MVVSHALGQYFVHIVHHSFDFELESTLEFINALVTLDYHGEYDCCFGL